MTQALTLTDPDLLRQQCFIGGRWLNATDGSTCDVFNPATGARIGSVPNMGASETREAIAAARRIKLTNEEGIIRLLFIK